MTKPDERHTGDDGRLEELVDAAVEAAFDNSLSDRLEDFFARARRCPECEQAGRFMLTTRHQCARCHNMLSPHKAEMKHWDEDGRPVEPPPITTRGS